MTRGRAALGVDGSRMLAVACDGRTDRDAGMTLTELAETLIVLLEGRPAMTAVVFGPR